MGGGFTWEWLSQKAEVEIEVDLLWDQVAALPRWLPNAAQLQPTGIDAAKLSPVAGSRIHAILGCMIRAISIQLGS